MAILLFFVIASRAEEVEDTSEDLSLAETESDQDDALLSLKNHLAEKLSDNLQWLVDEDAKVKCCNVAFDVCERPPNMTVVAFTKRLKTKLPVARNLCSKANSKPLKNLKQVCEFYHQTMNCAFTPNTEEDIDLYMAALPDCCMKAGQYCKFQQDYDLYLAKRACMGYAVRSESSMCDFSQSKDCQID